MQNPFGEYTYEMEKSSYHTLDVSEEGMAATFFVVAQNMEQIIKKWNHHGRMSQAEK